MNELCRIDRSPELMSRHDSALLVIDVQEKLTPLIAGHVAMVWNIGRLAAAAKLLGVSVAVTEQYPRGLGRTVSELNAALPAPTEKLVFSCGGCPEIFRAWHERGIGKVLLAGIEAHVCVQQTALDLLAEGFRVLVTVDAVGSRAPLDREIALRRMEASGAVLTTTEAALFEWCDSAEAPEFKQLSALVRQAPPAS